MRVRRRIAIDNLRRFSIASKSKSIVLDFGCSSGLLVKELSENGYIAHGIDIEKEAIEYGRKNGVKNLRLSKKNQLPYKNNYFSAVFCMDVLEHLGNEKWAVKEINRVLKPGGLFIIMVPAYMFLWGVQDEVSRHYRRYTKGQLIDRVARQKTWKIRKASYFNTFLFVPITAFRIVSRALKLNGRESDFDLNNKLLNKCLFIFFDAERRLLKLISFPFGVSILLVLEKSSE